MPLILDVENWSRKEHFNFFKDFEEPFFGITIEVDCTNAYKKVKAEGLSFFLYYLHASLLAANSVENFHYRIEGEKVIIYEKVNASATINREDGTFGFSYIDFHENFSDFVKEAEKEIKRVRNTKELLPAQSGDNVIHYSSIPWINFKALSHARKYSAQDSCPKISFGKLYSKEDRKYFSLSIHAHHGLMDARHVAQFIDTFQDLMNQ
ncbi:MAG: chloramphenicol acetyltransferase [Cyclobacteriaceae bacterium]|nr:chloramphenicol acetyltransferase [Cyclobacteriaceae bacterium]